MSHEIPEDVLNSNIEYCIREYVRLIEHRQILREKWFKGKTLGEISSNHNMSLTGVKDIVYGIGDKVLVKASKMSKFCP